MYKDCILPSGKRLHSYGQITIEIVNFPMNSMVIFHSYVNVYQRVISHDQTSHLKKKKLQKTPHLDHLATFQLIKTKSHEKKNLPGLVGEQLTQELGQIFT